MKKNLKVERGWFGAYKSGSVIPRYEASAYSPEKLDEMIRDGVLSETDENVNVELVPPKTAASVLESSSDMILESNQLRQENNQLKTMNDGLHQKCKDLEGTIASYKVTLGEQTAEISRLKGLLAESRMVAVGAETPDMTIKEAREIAAQAWCRPATQDRVMDPALAEEFAKILQNRCSKDAGFEKLIGKMPKRVEGDDSTPSHGREGELTDAELEKLTAPAGK